MDPFKETVQAETRRQFFGTAARGIGGLALASLFAEDAIAAPATVDRFGGLPDLPHFAPKAKQCIYLHMMGGAPPDGPARLQAEDEGVLRPGSAGLRQAGAAPDDDDLRAVPLPDRSVGVRVLPARRERRLVLRTAAPHGEHGGRHRDHPLDAHRSDQPRARHHLHPDRPADSRPALHRLLVRLRPGQHERGPAHLRRDERGTQSSRGRNPGDFREAVERRVPVARVCRGRTANRRRTGFSTSGIRKASRRQCAVAFSTA